MQKWNRKFTLEIEVPPSAQSPLGFLAPVQTLTLASPLTVEFSIDRRMNTHLNTASFKLYNLSRAHREQIFKDFNNPSSTQAIRFSAGYAPDTDATTQLPVIFNGTWTYAASVRDRSDWITEIEAMEGVESAATSFTAKTVAPGLDLKTIITGLASSMKGITGTAIGDIFATPPQRGQVLFGNTYELINQYTRGQCSIQGGVLVVLGQGQSLAPIVTRIDSDTGLLGTPRRAEMYMEVETLFEPRLIPGQAVDLFSTTAPQYNGTYQIYGLTHTGVISDSVAGDLRTSLRLLYGISEIKNNNVPVASL